MKQFLRCYFAEFIKQKHTIFYPLHLGIPIIFILLINLYLKFTWQNISVDIFLASIFQVLGIAMPFLSAIICGVVSEREAYAGDYQNILASSHSRVMVIVSKLSMLMTMCALSIGIALFGTILNLNLYWELTLTMLANMAITSVALWLCSVSLYVLHLFAGKRFRIGTCIIFGFFGFIIAALGLFSPFDFIGYFIPQVWGVRVTNKLIQRLPLSFFEVFIYTSMTILLILLVLIWFNIFEQRKEHE